MEPRGRVPFPILMLLLMVIMVPIEVNFNVGALLLTASRAYLFVLAFAILPRIGSFRWRSYDWFFTAHVLLSCLAFMRAYPGGDGIERAGSYALEFLIVYLAVRLYVRNLAQIRAVVGFLLLLVLISGALAAPEAFLRDRFIHDIATMLTGNRYPFSGETRMGILRAAAFFEHPILYGVFCSSLFSLVWFTSRPRDRYWKTPAIAFATWLSASSAPLLVFGLQLVLVGVERVTRGIERRLTYFAWATAGMVVILESFTGRGVAGTVALLTLNPATAYTRRSQWNLGIDDVMANPLLGFAAENWTRPHWLAASVDNWWLLMLMRSGIPSVVVLALCILTIWLALARRQETPLLFEKLRTGWGLMMIALILGGATVTYFGKLQPLFAFYVALGAALANCALPKVEGGDRPVASPPKRVLSYTRFPAAQPGE